MYSVTEEQVSVFDTRFQNFSNVCFKSRFYISSQKVVIIGLKANISEINPKDIPFGLP